MVISRCNCFSRFNVIVLFLINRLQPVESVLEKNIESPAEQVTLIVHSSVLIS